MKFSNEESFRKYDQIRSFLRIWSHLLKKSLMENFIFCEVTSKAKLGSKLLYRKTGRDIEWESNKSSSCDTIRLNPFWRLNG